LLNGLAIAYVALGLECSGDETPQFGGCLGPLF
jgi:hypothetical protein